MKVEENTGMTGQRPSTTYFQPRAGMLVNIDKAGMTGQRPSTTQCRYSHPTPSGVCEEEAMSIKQVK
jgi:hypothetical protein